MKLPIEMKIELLPKMFSSDELTRVLIGVLGHIINIYFKIKYIYLWTRFFAPLNYFTRITWPNV